MKTWSICTGSTNDLGEVRPDVQPHHDAHQSSAASARATVAPRSRRSPRRSRDGTRRARPDPGQVHQVANQPVHPIGLLEDRREQLVPLRRIVGDVRRSRLVTPALIDASGVRRSCVTLENSAARSRFVSASSCARRTCASNRARSSANAAWRPPPGASRSSPSRPGAPRRSRRSARRTRRPQIRGGTTSDGRSRPHRSPLRRTRVLAIAGDTMPQRSRSNGSSSARGEVVEDPIERVARQELRREVAEQTGITLACGRASRSSHRARPDEPHDRGDQQDTSAATTSSPAPPGACSAAR